MTRKYILQTPTDETEIDYEDILVNVEDTKVVPEKTIKDTKEMTPKRAQEEIDRIDAHITRLQQEKQGYVDMLTAIKKEADKVTNARNKPA